MSVRVNQPIKAKERIICPAYEILTGELQLTLVIPPNRLPGDIWNEWNRASVKLPARYGYITNHGRYVDAKEALEIALQADQIVVDKLHFAGELTSIDIFPLWQPVVTEVPIYFLHNQAEYNVFVKDMKTKLAEKEQTMADQTETETGNNTESKADKFKRIANSRLLKARDAIRTLRKCANKRDYDYSTGQTTKIISILQEEINYLENLFDSDVDLETEDKEQLLWQPVVINN